MNRHSSRAVTMSDVGAAAGVTARTVSNVLANKDNVRPQTREAVLKAVRDLGYQMNVSARGLRTGLTGMITLAIPDLGIEYFSELARLIMIEAENHGWTVIIQQTNGRRRTEIDVLSGANRQLSDGLIFQPHALGPGDEKVLAGGRPLVLLGERIFDGPVDHITMPNAEAARAATQYLIDRGRRRIAAIGSNPAGGAISTAALRLDGYRMALEANGLRYDERLVAIATDWHHANGQMAMASLLDARVELDAVFCFNDTLAFGALHALASRGLTIPDDVALVGFDNVTASAFTNPSLTTIEPGRRQIATTAIDLLARRISDGPSEHPSEIVSDYSLIARRSA